MMCLEEFQRTILHQRNDWLKIKPCEKTTGIRTAVSHFHISNYKGVDKLLKSSIKGNSSPIPYVIKCNLRLSQKTVNALFFCPSVSLNFFSRNNTYNIHGGKQGNADMLRVVKVQLFCIIHSLMRDNHLTQKLFSHVALMLAFTIFCVMDKNIKQCFENKFPLVENPSIAIIKAHDENLLLWIWHVQVCCLC